MVLLASLLAAAALAVRSARLARALAAARDAQAACERRLTPRPLATMRVFEGRRERSGLLWFPVLTADDDVKVVVGVSTGLPHCPRCVRPLKAQLGRAEEWVCPQCAARHPAMDADLKSTDDVRADCLREFFARHPDFTPAPGLAAPKAAQSAAA